MAVFEITGTHQGLVRGIVGSVLYGGLLLGAGLLDPRSYALRDIKLCAGLGVWIGGNSWASLYIGILTAQVSPKSSCCSLAASSGRGTRNGAESSRPARRWWPSDSRGTRALVRAPADPASTVSSTEPHHVNYTTATFCTVIFVAVAVGDQGRPIPVFATGHAVDDEPTIPPMTRSRSAPTSKPTRSTITAEQVRRRPSRKEVDIS